MRTSVDPSPAPAADGDKTVLILDRDPELPRSLARLLRPARFEFVQVRKASELFATLLAVRPSLILIDFALVDVSSIDLVAFLRCHALWRRIPVLVLTDETATAFPVRVDAPVVYKPDRAGLVARIEALVRPN
jgi:DNA-binding response OmpR family regulator